MEGTLNVEGTLM